MDQITHDVRRNSWLNIIQQCQARPEYITVKQWLIDNGIKDKAYYYWLIISNITYYDNTRKCQMH